MCRAESLQVLGDDDPSSFAGSQVTDMRKPDPGTNAFDGFQSEGTRFALGAQRSSSGCPDSSVAQSTGSYMVKGGTELGSKLGGASNDDNNSADSFVFERPEKGGKVKRESELHSEWSASGRGSQHDEDVMAKGSMGKFSQHEGMSSVSSSNHSLRDSDCVLPPSSPHYKGRTTIETYMASALAENFVRRSVKGKID